MMNKAPFRVVMSKLPLISLRRSVILDKPIPFFVDFLKPLPLSLTLSVRTQSSRSIFTDAAVADECL